VHNNLRILKFLLNHSTASFSASQLCKSLDMNLYSLRWAMVDLLVQGFVVIERGRPKLYSINHDLFNNLTKS